MFRNVSETTSRYLEEVRWLDEKEGRDELSGVEKRLREEKKGEIGRRLIQEEICWSQKSCALW